MRKNIIIAGALFLMASINVYGELSLTSNQIKQSTDTGYILSDSFNVYSECNIQKEKYNQEFTNYKRSECFQNGEGYNYFICQTSETCTVESSSDTINSNNTSNTTGVKISNQDKLDKFLLKIQGMKTELNNNHKYAQLLNSVIVKLTNLGTKYKNNATISQMITYLQKGVLSVKEEFEKNKDVDNFLCDLGGGCNSISSQEGVNSSNVTSATGVINSNMSGLQDCKVNLEQLSNKYNTVPLFTTFFMYNGKVYEPTAKGDLIIPKGFKDNINFGNKATNKLIPTVLSVQCDNGLTRVYNSNYSLIDTVSSGSVISSTVVINTISNDTKPSIQKIDLICPGNGWPASISISGKGDFNAFEGKHNIVGKNINLIRDSSTNNYIAQISESTDFIQISPYNSSEIIGSIKMSQCIPNTFSPKPEIISAQFNSSNKTLVVKTKNALSNDYIDIFDGSSNGGLFWEKDGNGLYTAKLTDPYYKGLIGFIESGKSNVGIYGSFEPNFWRNGVRNITYPISISDSNFTYSRINDNDKQTLSWSTTANVKNLSWISTGPNGTKSVSIEKLNRPTTYTTWEVLHREWPIGTYDMTWTITLLDGTKKDFKEIFTIQ